MKNGWVETFIPDDANKAISLITGCFYWDRTPEGHEYWKEVTEKLEAMVQEYVKFRGGVR